MRGANNPTMSESDLKMDDEDAREDRDQKLAKAHCGQLCEHFDTVQIICTRFESDKDGTIMASVGIGNYYARRGSVIEWLDSTKENRTIIRE